jgi:hypothetical protein
MVEITFCFYCAAWYVANVVLQKPSAFVPATAEKIHPD